MKTKIFGAGSIGNHLAHAARQLGWPVLVCDLDPEALRRMKEEIYPGRYGAWDDTIELFQPEGAPTEVFDLICIGTPPDSHVPLAIEAIETNPPRALQVEKPLCPPSLAGCDRLSALLEKHGIAGFVGYDHVVGEAAAALVALAREGAVGEIQTIDVEFREHWAGIFGAHPWLTGPHDSYLGFWERGGGASGEHSHALNFWSFLNHELGFGPATRVSASIRYREEDNGARYDDLACYHLWSGSRMEGRVVQDVITIPTKKEALVQGSEGRLRWICNHTPEGDAVLIEKPGEDTVTRVFPKKRPDDFIRELRHIEAVVSGEIADSIMSYERGLETARIVQAGHQSAAGCRVVEL